MARHREPASFCHSRRPIINTTNSIESTVSAGGDKTISVDPRRVHDKFTITENSGDKFKWQLVTVHGEKMKSGKVMAALTLT